MRIICYSNINQRIYTSDTNFDHIRNDFQDKFYTLVDLKNKNNNTFIKHWTRRISVSKECIIKMFIKKKRGFPEKKIQQDMISNYAVAMQKFRLNFKYPAMTFKDLKKSAEKLIPLFYIKALLDAVANRHILPHLKYLFDPLVHSLSIKTFVMDCSHDQQAFLFKNKHSMFHFILYHFIF